MGRHGGPCRDSSATHIGGRCSCRLARDRPRSGLHRLVNGIVYFSTLANRTYGLEARTGRVVWIYPDGEYTPVVADSHRLYVVGYRRMYAFTQR